MTAANEKPLPCPFCGTADPYTDNEGYVNCQNMDGCGAVVNSQTFWDRRAQPAEAVDEAKERKAFKRWYDFQSAVQHSPQADWAAEKAWLARARGGN